MSRKRIPDDVIRKAYEQTGNVWKAAKLAGCSGQTVQRRLKEMGIDRKNMPITEEESEAIRQFYETNQGVAQGEMKLTDFARSLGRTKHLISRHAKKLGLTDIRRKRSESQKQEQGKRTKRYIEENGHPRGALGITHSQETRLLLSNASKRKWESVTKKELQERWEKSLATRKANGTPWPNNPGGGSYQHCKRGFREDIGIYVRSAWEANWARYLNFLVANRVDRLTHWEYEPDTFWFDGIRRGVVSYMPDFKLFEKGREPYYQEVKGRMDDKSRTKLKRMAKYYPHIRVELIDEKAYKEVERKLGMVIPNWEFPERNVTVLRVDVTSPGRDD